MAAVELLESADVEERGVPRLRLVASPEVVARTPLRPSLAQRRARRARQLRRRHRTLAAVALLGALTILAVPGHVFGATTGGGLSTDLANSSTLASGTLYVVQPGDTLNSIARAMNEASPAVARAALVRELRSSVVVPGEHVLIP